MENRPAPDDSAAVEAKGAGEDPGEELGARSARVEAELRRRAKAHLRKQLRGTRAAIPASALAERSSRIVARVRELVRGAKAVALFWPIEDRHEVDLRELDAELRAAGVRIAYPAMLPAERDTVVDVDESIPPPRPSMTLRFVDDTSALEERGFGFREPDLSAPEPERLDFIVVPALALDTSGHRIGYGAGYYDRALPHWAPPARTIGVAFDFQLVAEVPTTEGDVPVDVVVTDARLVDVRRP